MFTAKNAILAPTDLDGNFFQPDPLNQLLRYRLQDVVKPSVGPFVQNLRAIEALLKEDWRRVISINSPLDWNYNFGMSRCFEKSDGATEITFCWIERPLDEDGLIYGGVNFGKGLIGCQIVPGREVDWMQGELSFFVPQTHLYRRLDTFRVPDGPTKVREMLTGEQWPDRELIVHYILPLDEFR